MTEESTPQESPKRNTDNELKSKEHLDRLKLEAEIRAINKPIYRRSEFYVAMLPVILGVLALIFSAASGFFDVKLDQIEVRKERLQIEVGKLYLDSVKLQIKFDSLKIIQEEKFNNYRVELQIEKDSIQQVNSDKQDSILAENEENSQELEDQLGRLRTSTHSVTQLTSKLKKSYEKQKELNDDIVRVKQLTQEALAIAKAQMEEKNILHQKVQQLQSAEDHWISLYEEYPPPNTKVLVFSRKPVGWHNNVRVGYFSDRNEAFYIVNGRNSTITEQVTHWRYIDKPEVREM